MQTFTENLTSTAFTEVLGGMASLSFNVDTADGVVLVFTESAATPSADADGQVVQTWPSKWDFDSWPQEAGLQRIWAKSLNENGAVITGIRGAVAGASSAVNQLSAENSSSVALAADASFTGEWVDLSAYSDVLVAVATDADGDYQVQFSPNGVDVDSSLTRHYRTNRINAPHRFVIARDFVRVVYENGAADQTYMRLQTHYGTYSNLNAPLDSTLSQDFDAIAVRPSDYNTEVAMGQRQGSGLWNKFGYNQDVDVGTEVVASWGGAFFPMLTATTISMASISPNDDGAPAGTGCNSVVIYGVDENRESAIEVFTLNGVTPVVSTTLWLGINRVAQFLCGSGHVNAGDITVTSTGAGTPTMAQMPAGGGVTQQCIFYVPVGHQFVMEWLRFNVLNRTKDAEMTLKMWVFSTVNNGKQAVYSVDIDTQKTNDISEDPKLPFPVSESSVVWMEATSDKANVVVNGRFSGILQKEAST